MTEPSAKHVRDRFDISELQWTDSDYLCPLCHGLFYRDLSDSHGDICVNPKCVTSLSTYTKTEINPALNQLKQRIDKSVERFYIFNRGFLYRKLYEIRKDAFGRWCTQGQMPLRNVWVVDFLFTKISHNNRWGTETNEQLFTNEIKKFLESSGEWLECANGVAEGIMLMDRVNASPYLVKYRDVIKKMEENRGIVDGSKYDPKNTHVFDRIDNLSGRPKIKHPYDLENIFKMSSQTEPIKGLFNLTYPTSQIHNYPVKSSHLVTLFSLCGRCNPGQPNTVTPNELREIYDGSVQKNKMNGNFEDFLHTYSSGIEYAPILVFDGQHYHFDYYTLRSFLLYLIPRNGGIDGIQTISGQAKDTQQRQRRADNFESAIRKKMRNDGFCVFPQNDSKKCRLRTGRTEHEFDCIAIDHYKKIIVFVEAKYEDISPSATSARTMIEQLVLDSENGLLHYAKKQHERRGFLMQNPNCLRTYMGQEFWKYEKHFIIVTKFTPMIKRHLTTVLMSFDEFEHMNFRDSVKD